MPMSELCDRYTIARLKQQRLPDDQARQSDLIDQINYYKNGINDADFHLGDLIQKLEKINGKIWDAEHNIRKGLDSEIPMEEIGRRALVVRDLNMTRIAVKNEIAEYTGEASFVDVKMNYATATRHQK
jgi:uncharacterized protein YdcH (DUF465 family)